MWAKMFDRVAWQKTYSAKQRRERGYHCYRGMLARCYNKKQKSYRAYGAKGVTVCKRWRGENGWENFLSDMGPRPSIKHSIDRYPNPKGNYKPSNCRWATASEQWHNRQRAQHGGIRRYKNYGCRCAACCEAKRKENKRYKIFRARWRGIGSAG